MYTDEPPDDGTWQQQQQQQHRNDRFYLEAITTDSGHCEPPWRVTLNIMGERVNFKVDSGADVTIISTSTFSSLNPTPQLRQSSASFHTPGGEITCVGWFDTPLDHDEGKYMLRIHVIDGQVDNLLSRNAATKLGFIQFIHEVISDKPHVFGDISEPAKCDPIHISLKPDAAPYSIGAARRIPLPLYDKVKQEIQRMENLGVISQVTEATDWCSPLTVVVKPNGKVRICADLQKLNKSVKRERFIIPTVDDVLANLKGASMFSTLDASSGYWQLPLDEESKLLTTFISPFGRYHFNRLPFGINSASEIFQREMMKILDGLDGVVCYQDDILVFGDTDVEHDKRLDAVMSRLSAANVKLNREKCKFRQRELTFLGHHISPQGIRTRIDKVKAIVDMEQPSNTSELKRFMGMALGRTAKHCI